MLLQPAVLVNDEGLHATADEANKLTSADLALMVGGTEAAHRAPAAEELGYPER